MGASPEEQVLRTVDQLAEFLADLRWTPQRFVYRDVEIETIVPARRGPLVLLLFHIFAFALARSAQQLRGDGLHLRLTLPVAVVADLRLESRDEPLSGEDEPLAKHFYWSATSDELLRKYLASPTIDTLVRLSTQYKVLMTDETIRIGPLAHAPAADAQAIDALVSALPRPNPTDLDSDPPIGPEAQERGPTVLLRCTTSRIQADLWRTLLENAGLPCGCQGYESTPPWGAASPPREIRLLVPQQHLEAARALLERAAQANGMRLCHQCGETASAQSAVCPACGAALESGADEA